MINNNFSDEEDETLPDLTPLVRPLIDENDENIPARQPQNRPRLSVHQQQQQRALRTITNYQRDYELRSFIESNRQILQIKLSSSSSTCFAVNLACFFFTKEELGAYNTNVLGRGPKGYEGQIKHHLDTEKVNCIRKLVLSYHATTEEDQREKLWNKCVGAINKKCGPFANNYLLNGNH